MGEHEIQTIQTILIADDNLVIVKLLRTLLTRTGYQVDEAKRRERNPIITFAALSDSTNLY